MIVIDLSKQQAFDSDPGAIQEINFTVNLDRVWNLESGTTTLIVSNKEIGKIMEIVKILVF